jgi:uncharacterized protein YbjQ (UPF0145 family)
MTNPGAMFLTTAPSVDGYRVTRSLGIVRGIVVRSPGLARGILGGLKSLFQGNISQFEDLCEAARAQASERMVSHAQQLGANAIINMRYDATEFSQGITEVLAYGTAVQLAAE